MYQKYHSINRQVKAYITNSADMIAAYGKAKAVRFSTLEAICKAWTASPETSSNTLQTNS